ncbi:HNH endonuclease [Porphyromonas gingivalis]|uniref:HNH endonuclease n=1 Tax=Porphyromonas gingivalis TaxID=837 RepID=UPI001B8BDBAD|nr:HNH endonuclease [Porphyromonas gingivalis]QUI88952.1 HNH endonuclease [Porphyromonas gingivalis]QUI90897.1 HNH endonuclease [Porphyromonas gingivalis]
MNNWTREETIIAFNLYCKIDIRNSHKNHPLIIKYAKLLGRTPSALNMKIGNIARLDPDLKQKGISGLTHGAKSEQLVWDEFYGNPDLLAYESEKLIAIYSQKSIEESTGIEMMDLPNGKEREAIVKQRVNQSFFRSTVLNAYDYHCCISGISIPTLLEACHIIGWSEDSSIRTNPQNGLCMNPLFHKAFDNFLVTITPDMIIVISEEMITRVAKTSFQDYLRGLNGRQIMLPNKFMPRKDFLNIHYERFKKR